MKISKTVFKELLKESILELINEGKLDTDFLQEVKQPNKKNTYQAREESSSSGLIENERLNNAVKITANLIAKGDPKKAALLEQIVADTARTTLQKQIKSELSLGSMDADLPATPEQKEKDNQQLNLFAAKDRWAEVAFSRKTS